MELISIIMPVYNTSTYLKECLESIIQQSVKNWELIAIDDFSQDNSLDILTYFAQKDPRIKVLQNLKKGIIPALKLGFDHSQGNFITRMDSDDLMMTNKLEVLQKLLITHGKKHLACGPVKYFSDKGIGDGFKKYESWLNGLIKNGNNFDERYKECVIPSPSWMCFREDFLNCGGFNSDIYPEDYDLTFRFYKGNLKCIPCEEILHHWRDYESRTSRTHPHYADNTFIDLKVHHFLQTDFLHSKKIVIWGAGRKGKKIAQLLNRKKIDFHWICDNPNKIGHDIYGKQLLGMENNVQLSKCQSIITVANSAAQKEIGNLLEQLTLKEGTDYFFFC